MRRILLFSCLIAVASSAQALELEVPIACEVGKECFVQNYVDHGPGIMAVDYNCGTLTYDDHKGTDIRLKNILAMQKGVNVLAAAPGMVQALRDGVMDVSFREGGPGSVKARECGNGILILTDDGYETQYCHMKKGSIAVKQGERVQTGQVLGQVGLSGMTEFPHLHFELRKDGKILDPFTGADRVQDCTTPRQPLWSAHAAPQMRYVGSAVLDAGFAGEPAEQSKARIGAYGAEKLPVTVPALVFWTDIMGADAGDVLTLTLVAPNGEILASNSDTLGKHKAQIFNFVGIKNKTDALAKGIYKGMAVMTRKNPQVGDITRVEKSIVVE